MIEIKMGVKIVIINVILTKIKQRLVLYKKTLTWLYFLETNIGVFKYEYKLLCNLFSKITSHLAIKYII